MEIKQEDISKKSDQHLLNELTLLQREIELRTFKYNLIVGELCKRHQDRADNLGLDMISTDHIKL